MGLIDFFKGFFKQKSGKREEVSSDKKEYMSWNDGYSVNIKEIDEQHKVLISLINQLYDAMQVGKGKEVLSTILDNMINYVGTHFSNEEKYMEDFGYPDYEKHKAEHNDFVKKTLDFQKGFSEGKIGLSVEVMFFLKEWTVSHIMGSDKKYSPFFNQKGIK